jgi:hypothetical protein
MMQNLRNIAGEIRGLFFFTNPTETAEAAAWRDLDLTRLKDAPGLELAAVGRMLGAGLQHRIYEYAENGQPKVLKVLLPNRLLRFPTAPEARQDLELVSKYFGPFAVEPARVISLGDGSYAIAQRRLGKFRGITRDDLRDGAVRQQVLEIVRRNRQMMQETGRGLDFLGREGQRKSRAALIGLGQTPTISNLVVESQPDGSERVRLLDTDLENFRPGAHTFRDLRSSWAARLAFEINRFLIKRFFGIDVAKGEETNQ